MVSHPSYASFICALTPDQGQFLRPYHLDGVRSGEGQGLVGAKLLVQTPGLERKDVATDRFASAHLASFGGVIYGQHSRPGTQPTTKTALQMLYGSEDALWRELPILTLTRFSEHQQRSLVYNRPASGPS
jgi:hypothetical protein